MGPEFCRTLSHWIRNTSGIYLFDSSQTDSIDITGMTDLGAEPHPAIHIVLLTGEDHSDPDQENARTFIHELMHVREYHHGPLKWLEIRIRRLFRKYRRQGLTDRVTESAASQEGYEQLSWALEALNLGVEDVPAEVWREHRPKLVRLIRRNKKRITPPLSTNRERLVVAHKPPAKKEPGMITKIGTVLAKLTTRNKRPTKFICRRPPGMGFRYPTHPLTRGVLYWLKAQAERALATEPCRWDGCYTEYEKLKQGTHPDPNPGQIITPDDPDSFKPEMLDITEDTPLEGDDIYLKRLEPLVNDIDHLAWLRIEKELKQEVTHERYAQHCIRELEAELRRHEREVWKQKNIDIKPKKPGPSLAPSV